MDVNSKDLDTLSVRPKNGQNLSFNLLGWYTTCYSVISVIEHEKLCFSYDYPTKFKTSTSAIGSFGVNNYVHHFVLVLVFGGVCSIMDDLLLQAPTL